MSVRELEFRDGPDLLAWAQDPEGSRFFTGDAQELTLADMEGFILASLITSDDQHLAITDQQDRVVGLVSLKNIHQPTGLAEFSIGLLPAYQGQGLASQGAAAILAIAFEELELDSIYMYTSADNQATKDFNDRQGFRPLPGPPEGVTVHHQGLVCWYELTREEYLARKK